MHRAAERLRQSRAGAGLHLLAPGLHDDRHDVEATGGLLLSDEFQRARVGGEDRRIDGIQCRDDIREGTLHRGHPIRSRAPGGAPSRSGLLGEELRRLPESRHALHGHNAASSSPVPTKSARSRDCGKRGSSGGGRCEVTDFVHWARSSRD